MNTHLNENIPNSRIIKTSSSGEPNAMRKLEQILANENKNEKTRKTMEHLLKDILFTSLSHSILKLFLTRHLILKIFLFIFILVTSGLASYLVIQSVMTYFTYEVSTKSRTIFETPTLFPKVTFCNVNRFTTQYAFQLLETGIQNSQIDALSNEEKIKLGHNLEDILIDCHFNNMPCNYLNFTWSYDETYGNCYTFNSGFDMNATRRVDLKKSSIAGWNFGLQLTLYVNIYEKFLRQVPWTGALVRIGNSSYVTDYSNGGIFVAPGFQTNIVLGREFKLMLPRPYSQCEIDSESSTSRSDSDLYNLIGRSDYDYSQQLCLSQCIQRYVNKNYNCSLPQMPSLDKVRQCEFLELISLKSAIFSREIFNEKFINEMCLPMCPLECNQTLYETSISSNKLNEQFWFYLYAIQNNPNLVLDFAGDNKTLDLTRVRDSFVSVNVFYDKLSYTLTTESPQMDVVSLLSSIGANLGLFLEISLFSLCEIIEVAIEIFFNLKRSK